MILKIYKILTQLSRPFIYIYLQKRLYSGKEDSARFHERFGHPSLLRPEGNLIWIHAASVGESISVLPMINKLVALKKKTNFLITTGTTSSAKLIASRLPERTFHQYVPIDQIASVQRFLNHWQPDLALWVESELWPNLVTEAAKCCKMVLLNGRMSNDSYKKWQRYKSLGNRLIGCFGLILAQSQHDAERFRGLGGQNVKYLGNIKFDSPALPADAQKIDALLAMIGQRPVWLAASTHANEEETIAGVHKKLKQIHPEILTIIAPRHPKRAEDIRSVIKSQGINVALRSQNEEINGLTDVYLADTLGELGIFYRLAPIVFIGGSLVNHGGQNPLEAARLHCAIIYGPHMENFLEIKNEFEGRKASVLVEGTEDLHNIVAELITDQNKQRQLANAALELVNEKSGVIDAYVAALEL
jgi:3-deoxy-D-manno-octulosonic-acid transferase